MSLESNDEGPRSPAHQRLLRQLLLSQDGIDAASLSDSERDVVDELVREGLAVREGARIYPDRTNPALGALFAELRSALSNDSQEIERLRAEHREVVSLLTFLQDLLNGILGCRTIAELFRSAFRRLAGTVTFDIGCAVMLEQNLDLYLSKLPQHEETVSQRLVDAIRRTLDSQIAASFVSTDVVIRGDFSDLPTHGLEGDPLTHQVQSLLRLENRIAGSLILYRTGPAFTNEEQRILDILSDQVAIVLGNIRANEQIQSLADTDDLTGIWNKRVFRRQLPSEVERARTYGVPLALMLFDVDDFKNVNDTYGHVIGDVLLSELCGTVRETLRPPDVFARFGGDEFAVILPHTDLMGARSAAERMIWRVRELALAGPDERRPIRCTISIGLAALASVDKSAAGLIERADQKLYESKRLGKDRYSW